MRDHVTLAYDYPVLGVFLTALWVFLGVLWIFLLFRVIADIFRDDSMNGLGKTGWLLFVILLPFLGVFVYIIARGAAMGQREQQQYAARQKALDTYIRETAASSEADQLAKLGELRSHGDLSDEEFNRAKEKVLH
jgi:energy-coupling factor transporter transmembrane protein EcfT